MRCGQTAGWKFFSVHHDSIISRQRKSPRRHSCAGLAHAGNGKRVFTEKNKNETNITMKTTVDYSATFRSNRFIKQTLLPAALGILMAAMPAPAWAKPRVVIPFTDARIRIEVNATDGDSGLHVLLDAEGWKFVNITDPRGRLVFHVAGGGSVKKTGLTELFFESAEPGFEELPLDQFLARFPAGDYRFVGETITGKKLSSKAKLTHALPDGPVLLSPEEGAVVDPNNTLLRWEAVPDPAGSRIVRYEVLVVEDGSVPKRVLSATVPATATSMVIPPTFLVPNSSYKWEILAIEEGGNQTLSERSFLVGP